MVNVFHVTQHYCTYHSQIETIIQLRLRAHGNVFEHFRFPAKTIVHFVNLQLKFEIVSYINNILHSIVRKEDQNDKRDKNDFENARK